MKPQKPCRMRYQQIAFCPVFRIRKMGSFSGVSRNLMTFFHLNSMIFPHNFSRSVKHRTPALFPQSISRRAQWFLCHNLFGLGWRCWILVNRWNIWYICATSNTSILKASCTGNGCKRKNIRGSIRIKIQNSDSDYSRVVFWLFFRQHGIILFPKYWVLNKYPWVFDKKLLSFEILLS